MAVLLASWLLGNVLPAGAQVVLYPNQIAGTIAWNNPAGPVLNHLTTAGFGNGVGSGYLLAAESGGGPNQATKSFLPDSGTSTLYEITVNGSDTGIQYVVSPTMTMRNNYTDFYHFASAASAGVLYDTVNHLPGAPVLLDFIECAGLIHVHYRSSAGVPVPVDSSGIYARLQASGLLQAFGSPVPYSGATDHTLIVRGDAPLNLTVSADVHTGSDTFLDYIKFYTSSNYTITVPCNGEMDVTLIIPDLSGPPVGGYGQIVGVVDMLTEKEHWVDDSFTVMSAYNGPQGNFRSSDLWVQPSGPCGSPSSPFVGTPSCTSAGQFVLPYLLPSDFFPVLNDPAGPRPYNLLGRLIYGTGQRFQRFETPVLIAGSANNSPVTVTAGGTVDLGNTFVMNPGWVVGDVYLCCPDEPGKLNSPLRNLNRLSDVDNNLDGIPDNLAWDYTSQVIASGRDVLGTGATKTAVGAAGRTLFPGSFHDSGSDQDHFVGDYRLTLGGLNSETTRWDQRPLYLNFVNANPANHLSSQVIIRNNHFYDVEIVPTQTITNHHRYGMSRVVVTFHSDDPGTTLYHPRITGNGSWVGADFEGHAADYTAQIHYADGTPKDYVNAAVDGQIILCLPQGNYTFEPQLESVTSGSSTHNVLPNFSQYVGPCSSITSTPCLQIALTNAPDCPTNRAVTIAGSITSCTNVASITYKLNTDPVVTVCNNCGVNPTFAFGITLADCVNQLIVIATDVNGDVASVSQTLHYDVTPPVLSGCTNFSTNSIAGPNGNFVSYTITALDNCDGPVPVVYSPPSGSFFPVGSTLVTCTAWDHCLNTNTCTFTVTVAGAGTNCCDDCVEPYPVTINAPVAPGINYLANPLCHGTNNTLGALLVSVPEGTVLKKWDTLTGTYSPEYTYDSGFGGWVDSSFDDASGAWLQPGEGFLLINPNGPFTNTWTGCLPDCPPPCLPTNGCVLVGRRGPGTAVWTNLSSCPPICGTEVRIWNGTGFDSFTFDPMQGWLPYEPVLSEGHSAFVCLDSNMVCCTNNLVINGSFELTTPPVAANGFNNALDPVTGGHGWTTGNGEFLEVWANTVSGIPAADGVNQLEINARSDDQTVSQTITNLSTNCPVEFCFQYTGRFGMVSNSPNNDFTVTLNGGFAMSVTLDPAQYATNGWLRFCTNFLPTTSTLTIAFRGQPHYSDGTVNTEGGAHIDNVSLTQCCLTNPCTQPPVIICATNKSVDCGAGWDFDPPTFVGGCCGTNVTISILSTTTNGPCPVFTRVWQATDCFSNSLTCTQTVTVVDTTPPVFSGCPTGAIALPCNAAPSCATVAGLGITVVDTCNGNLTPICTTGAVVSVGCQRIQTFTLTATDACQNSSTCDVTFNWTEDLTPPTLSGCTNRVVASEPGTNGALVFFTVTAFDNCAGVVPVNCIPPSGSFFPIGQTVVTCVAVDFCGNTNTCSHTVTVIGSTNTNCCDNCTTNDYVNYTVVVHPGFNFFANALCRTNTLSALLPNQPDNTTVYKWDPQTQDFDPNAATYSMSAGLWFPDLTLELGEGFALANPGSAYTNTFIGCEPVCPLPCGPTNNACHILGAPGLGASTWTNLYSCPPTCGTTLGIWNGGNQDWDTYTYLNGSWSPSTPYWDVGLAVKVCVQTNTNCLPCTNALSFTCPTNKTVKCGAAWAFDSVTASNDCCASNSITITIQSTMTNGICPRIFQRVWQITDCVTNIATCTQTVTVVDTTPPVIACSAAGQNLVPNPSFEDHTGCPFDFSQINFAPPWFRPTQGTPDYFNDCATWNLFDVPLNGYGDQAARTGQAYTGGHMVSANEYREYIESPLLSPLLPGHTYQVSFYVALADYLSDVATDNLGAYFSTGPLTDFGINSVLPVTPQVRDAAGVFLSSFSDWMLVQGTFTAAGGETHITIGNFYNTANTPTIPAGSGNSEHAYYFVDDVSVTETCTGYPTNKTVNCVTNWSFDLPVAVEVCSGTNVSVTVLDTVTNSGPCPTVITRTWLVSDLCSNSVTWSQTVTVVDATPPVLTCASNKTVECCASNAATLGSNYKYTVLKQFLVNDADGEPPRGGLHDGGDGFLYGMTYRGGDFQQGTVYRVDKNGNGFEVLHHFGDTASDGQNPSGALVEDANGTLYGCTDQGGPGSGAGTIFKIEKNGPGFGYLKLKSFAPVNGEGRNPATGLMKGSDGAFYGTTRASLSDTGKGTVFKFEKVGLSYVFTVLHHFPDSAVTTGDGETPWAPLMEARDERLYGATLLGGSGGKGTIFTLKKDGTDYKVLVNLTGLAGNGARPYAAPIEAASEDALYFTTRNGGVGERGTVYKLQRAGGIGDYNVLTQIKQFLPGGDDGVQPFSPLLQGNDGALYGTTYTGGSGEFGTVFRTNPDGSDFIILKSFSNTGDGRSPFAGLIQDGAGLFYGTAEGHGGVVFKLEKEAPCGWTFDPPTATDDCCTNLPITVLNTITNGFCPQVISRAWQVMDCCSNISTCTQTVTVVDHTPPVIVGCSNIFVTIPHGQVAATVNYFITATDSCSSPVTLTFTPPPGTFPVGLTPVTCVAEDACGNTSTCQFNVKVTEELDCPDLAVNVTATYPGPKLVHIVGPDSPCCGSDFTYHIHYANNGILPVSGATIQFSYPQSCSIVSITSPCVPPVSYSSFVPNTTRACSAPFIPSSGLETFNLPTLNPGDRCSIAVKVHLCCDILAACGNQLPLKAQATILPLLPNDCKPWNNAATLSVRPCCSHDPNDCTVSPAGCGPEGFIHRDQALTYRIRFQNEGGGMAHEVGVQNILDEDLDLSTLEILNASHPYLFERNGRELLWIFHNIDLPSQNDDEDASQGFVTFRIRPFANAPVGTVINNGADIYFDANEPVTTITTINTITEDPVPVASFTVVPHAGSAGYVSDFLYTGGTPGAQCLWNFGADATPQTSTDLNPSGVVFATAGPHLVVLETSLGDCVAEPAVQLVTVGRPTLNFLKTTTELSLSWAGDGFILEETASLTPPIQWHTISAPQTFVGGWYRVNVPTSTSGDRFYRLTDTP